MVSLDSNGDIIGYITANLNRDSKVASSFAMINFTKKINIILSRDVLKFLKNLRHIHQASKFEFTKQKCSFFCFIYGKLQAKNNYPRHSKTHVDMSMIAKRELLEVSD